MCLIFALGAGGCSEREALPSPSPAPEQPSSPSPTEDSGIPTDAVFLPVFSLIDAHGQTHASTELLEGGLVLVVTSPTLSSQDAQEGWSEVLVKQASKELAREVVFLEDISVSWFPNKARSRMKEDSSPTEPPLLLLDEDGSLCRQLGVPEEETWLLVFDESGRLRLTWETDPSAEVIAMIEAVFAE